MLRRALLSAASRAIPATLALLAAGASAQADLRDVRVGIAGQVVELTLEFDAEPTQSSAAPSPGGLVVFAGGVSARSRVIETASPALVRMIRVREGEGGVELDLALGAEASAARARVEGRQLRIEVALEAPWTAEAAAAAWAGGFDPASEAGAGSRAATGGQQREFASAEAASGRASAPIGPPGSGRAPRPAGSSAAPDPAAPSGPPTADQLNAAQAAALLGGPAFAPETYAPAAAPAEPAAGLVQTAASAAPSPAAPSVRSETESAVAAAAGGMASPVSPSAAPSAPTSLASAEEFLAQAPAAAASAPTPASAFASPPPAAPAGGAGTPSGLRIGGEQDPRAAAPLASDAGGGPSASQIIYAADRPLDTGEPRAPIDLGRPAAIFAGGLGRADCEAADTAVRSDPWDLPALKRYAACLALDGDPVSAETVFRRLLTFTPDDRQAELGLAVALHERGEVEDAAATYQRLLEAASTDSEASQLRALMALAAAG